MSDEKNPGEQNVSLSGATFKQIDGGGTAYNKNVKGKVMLGSKDEPSLYVEAQYNPKELEISKTVPWSKVNEANKANQGSNQGQGIHLEFTGAEGRSLSLDMWFDGVETNTSIAPQIEKLERLASVRRAGATEEEFKRPHRCLVVWGDTVNMNCVIDGLTVKYLMFSSDGKPLRAQATVKLKEADVVTAKSSGNKKKGTTPKAGPNTPGGANGSGTPSTPSK